jgi:hypothetical protein
VGDVSLEHAVANAWNEVQGASRTTSLTGIAGPPNDSMASPGVVHIVGAPIETGYGDAALQIARSTGGGQTIVYSSANVAERGGQLVRMRDLRHWFQMTDVFLLQANPIAGAIRGPTDQECAGFLRVMAAELAELGASAALTIPPLPVRDSMRCLARIGRAVTGGDAPSMESLLAAVDDARHVVLDEGTLKLGDRAAAASDFCIYLKSVTLRP